jgi:hypothetical protein
MEPAIKIDDGAREQLRLALLDEADLFAVLRHAAHEEVGERPGFARAACTLAVRRPLDPETSELRRVQVLLRRDGDGWTVESIDGLGVES